MYPPIPHGFSHTMKRMTELHFSSVAYFLWIDFPLLFQIEEGATKEHGVLSGFDRIRYTSDFSKTQFKNSGSLWANSPANSPNWRWRRFRERTDGFLSAKKTRIRWVMVWDMSIPRKGSWETINKSRSTKTSGGCCLCLSLLDHESYSVRHLSAPTSRRILYILGQSRSEKSIFALLVTAWAAKKATNLFDKSYFFEKKRCDEAEVRQHEQVSYRVKSFLV